MVFDDTTNKHRYYDRDSRKWHDDPRDTQLKIERLGFEYDETVDDMVFFQTELQEFTLSLKVNITFLNDYSRNDFKNVSEQKMFILANSETV